MNPKHEQPVCFTEYTHGTPIPGTPPPRPCPFCASLDVSINGQDDGCGYRVECHGCHCEGPLCESALDAAKQWNDTASQRTRAGGRSIDPVVEARVEAAGALAIQASSVVEIVESVLRPEDHVRIGDTGAVELAVALAWAKKALHEVYDRLDIVNLRDASRRIVVKTADEDDEEVPEAA